MLLRTTVTLLLILCSTTSFARGRRAKRAEPALTQGPALFQVLTELKPLVDQQAKKCDEWIEKLIDIVPDDVRGKSKYPLTLLPKLYSKIDEFPNTPDEISSRLELLTKAKLKSDNAKEEAVLLNNIETVILRCSPLSAVAFLDNLIESIPPGDTETLKQLSAKLSEKIAPEVEGGNFFPATLTQAGVLESALEHFPDHGASLSSRAGGILHRGQKLKIKYHRKLIGTSIEESARDYLKFKLEGLKESWNLRQQLRQVMTDAGLRRVHAVKAEAPKAAPSPAPSAVVKEI